MNVSEHILSEEIAHAIDLQRYSSNVVRRVIALLNRTDSDISVQVERALDALVPSEFTVERLDSLLAQFRALNTAAYLEIEALLRDELRGLVDAEVAAQYKLFASAVPEAVGFKLLQVSGAQVATVAMARPFQGRLLREWIATLEAGRAARVRDEVRQGIVQSQTNAQIIQRLRGTRANAYRDGALQIDRRHAEAIVRTATAHVASVVRDAFHEANADLVKAVIWVSTLDGRTTEACRIRDGLRYAVERGRYRPIGHAVPWLGGPGRLHWRCRSASSPVLKSWQELGIDAAELSAGERASMDGAVPAETTYGAWIKAQSAARQDEILGPTRGRLMREGRLPFDRLYTERGRPLTLEELRAREPEAFRRAGGG